MNDSNKNPMPPKWMERLFEWFCHPDHLEVLQGDLYELYSERVHKSGVFSANLFLFLNIISLFRPSVLKRPMIPNTVLLVPMLKNYTTVSLRNILKTKTYSMLNLSGLAIGIGCFLLIFLYIQDELNYDRFHDKSHRIYRVAEYFESEGMGERSASLPFPSGPAFLNDYPGQIEHAVRLFNFQSPVLALANRDADKAFNESRLFFADSSFLDVFDFELHLGDRATALDQPNSILITPSMAQKYFPNDDPMGKILEFQGTQDLKVTGIIQEPPSNSHFRYDFIVSFSSLKQWFNGQYPTTWYWNPCWTYIVLSENTSAEQLTSSFPAFVQKYLPDFIKDDVRLDLQPIHDIHLYSKLDYEIEANGNITNIYVFGSIAIFVLIIAGINFINLSTARATNRAKEVGVRKSIGSGRFQLFTQFVFESVLMTYLSLFISLVLVALLLPTFNSVVDKSIAIEDIFSIQLILGIIGLGAVIGLCSGLYPAFVLSSFQPVIVLKRQHLKPTGLDFRRVLVIAQFVISMFLIVDTIVGFKQLNLLRNQGHGFDKEHLIMIPVIRSPMGNHYDVFRNQALKSSFVHSVTGVEEIVGVKHQVGNYRFEGMDRSKPFPRFNVLHDYTETLGIPLVAGRDFDRDIDTDDSLAILVNEAMVRGMGWESPDEAINKRFYYNNELRGQVVGVLKDYHFISKHHPIGPLVLDLNTNPRAFDLFIKYLAVRIDGSNIQQAILDLEEAWVTVVPERPFDYLFLDEQLNNSYKAERKLSQIAIIFSALAILVACLGLFGLATFSIEYRNKEIGILKVLGVSTLNIITRLFKEFFSLILVAFILAAPVSYFLVRQWLDGFAVRIDLEIWAFVFSGVITLIITVITVSFHMFKISRLGPSEVLQHE